MSPRSVLAASTGIGAPRPGGRLVDTAHDPGTGLGVGDEAGLSERVFLRGPGGESRLLGALMKRSDENRGDVAATRCRRTRGRGLSEQSTPAAFH
ncbi:unnamed protein product [Lampetra planeri]